MSDQKDRLVLLDVVFNSGAAHMIRGLLETNDIYCEIFDENPAGVGMGLREIRVMVMQSQLEEAKALLKDIQL